jgi:hypothetical protein
MSEDILTMKTSRLLELFAQALKNGTGQGANANRLREEIDRRFPVPLIGMREVQGMPYDPNAGQDDCG